MKKFLLASLLSVCFALIFSLCVSAETVFETEKVIKCDNISKDGMTYSSYDKSIGDSVYFTFGDFVKDPAEITAPEMSFKINIPQEGNYMVYVHAAFTSNSSDSFYYKFDDMPWKDVHPNSKGESLVWFGIGTNYLTPGEHTFYWHHRESGSYFDCFSVIGANSEFKIVVEGNTLVSDGPPCVENGVSLAPFRALAEALGAEVSWNDAERSATIKTDKVSLTVVENSPQAYFGKFPMNLDTPAKIIKGRFMVPVRFIANNLQHDVTWFSGTNHAFIIKK